MGERPLTLAEVAEHYRFSERKLRRFVREHDVPVLREGRDIRFDALALSTLAEALRTPCRSKSPGANPPARSPSVGRSPVNAYAAALEATASPSRERKPRPSKPKFSDRRGTANVVALDHSPRRS